MILLPARSPAPGRWQPCRKVQSLNIVADPNYPLQQYGVRMRCLEQAHFIEVGRIAIALRQLPRGIAAKFPTQLGIH